MLIVPETDTLLAEVKVDPKDIDQIQLGQPVVLRFSAFNMRTTPELNGISGAHRARIPPLTSAAGRVIISSVSR